MTEFLNDLIETVGPFVIVLAVVIVIAAMFKVMDWMD